MSSKKLGKLSTHLSAVRKYTLRIKYGLTVEGYNDLFLAQRGRCKICSKHQSDLPKALSVDHNHETREIRGLLCLNCNVAIGLLGEDAERCILAAEYLGFVIPKNAYH